MYQNIILMIPVLIPVCALLLSLTLIIAGILRQSTSLQSVATLILLATAALMLRGFNNSTAFIQLGTILNAALFCLIIGAFLCLAAFLLSGKKQTLHLLHVPALFLILVSFNIYMKEANLQITQIENEHKFQSLLPNTPINLMSSVN